MEIDPTLPIDKLAAMVVSKDSSPQIGFNPGNKIVSHIQLPTRQFCGRKCDDLTGLKSGRFTVIGCATFMPKNWRTSENNTRWVVRCVCGTYQILTTRAVKKKHPDNMCVNCQKTKSLKYKALKVI